MPRNFRTLSLVAYIVSATLTSSAFSQTQPATTQPDSQQLTPLISALSDDDFLKREAAQKQLDALPWQALPTLRKLQPTTTDAEAKARLDARIEAIEDQLAVTPPPISLDLKDATLSQVCDALNAATSASLSANFGQKYTLKVQDASFISIIDQLNKQHPFEISSYRSIVLQSAASNVLAVTPQAIISCSESYKWDENPAWKTYSVPCHILIDPRVKIVDCAMTFSDAHDDLGNPIKIEEWPQPGAFPKAAFDHNFTARVPAVGGTKLTAKGQMRLTIAVRTDSMLILNPDKRVNQPIKLGRGSITLTEFKAGDKEVSFALSRSHSSEAAAQAVIDGTSPSAAELLVGGRLLDADGGELMDMNCSGGSISSETAPVAKLPLKIELGIATKTKTLSIPIELRDIPLR